MKRAELKDLRGGSEDELRAKVRELKEDLFHLRFQHRTGQLRNSAKLREARRDVARVETLLRERSTR